MSAPAAPASLQHNVLIGALGLYFVAIGLVSVLRPERMVAWKLRWIDRLSRWTPFFPHPEGLKRMESGRLAIWSYRIVGALLFGFGVYLLLMFIGIVR